MKIFYRLVRSKWMAAVLFLADLFFWYISGLSLPFILLLQAITFPILWASWRVYRGSITPGKRTLSIVSVVLALLFCFMLPFQKLTDLDRLVNDAAVFSPPGWVLRLVNLLENVSAIGLLVLFLSLLISALWIKISQFHPVEQPEQRPIANKVLRTLFYAAPCLVVWSAVLYVYWPGILTADSIAQWAQIQNLHILSDWNPVGHTLFEYLLTRIWFHPAMISIFQVGWLALAWGWAMVFFEGRGISRRILFLSSVVFALLPFNGILLVTLWKDIPFAITNFILVFLLGRIWYSGGEWLKQWRNCALLGAVLACAYLFRHNGLLLLIFIPPAILLLYFRLWRRVLLTTLVAVSVVFLVRNVIAFGVFQSKPVSSAPMYAVPMQHISAVIHYGGTVTDEQAVILERFAPMKVWKEEYNPYMADTMSKPWGAMQDTAVLKKIEINKNDLLRVFIDLARKYPSIVFRSELDLMSLQWEIIMPEEGYRWWKLDFAIVTEELPDWINHPEIFAHPQRNTPLKAAFDHVLLFSDQSPLPYAIFWRGGLYLFLSAVFATILFFTKGWRSILIALPLLLNSLSLALSMTVQNFRYIYPNVLITLLLVFFAFLWPRCPAVAIKAQPVPDKL